MNDLHNGTMNGNLNGKPNSHMYNGIVSDVESDCKIDNRDLYGSVNSRATFPHRVLPDRPKTPAGESTGNCKAIWYKCKKKKKFLSCLRRFCSDSGILSVY